MHPVFSIAVFDRPLYRAFGLDLQPLTLGHLFLLRECRSKVLLRSKDCSLGDVLFAAFICSAPHARSRKNLERTWRLNRFLSRWARIATKTDLVQETRKFYHYFHTSFSCPTVADAKPGEPPQTPEEWRTLAMLMADFHMTREQALDTGLAWATAMWAANAERTAREKFQAYEADAGTDAAWKAQHAIDLAKAVKPRAEHNGEESSCSA